MRRCKHCGEKSGNQFCCLGCESAYHLINSLNLDQFYEFCSNVYKTNPQKPEQIKNCYNYADYIHLENEKSSINLIIEGVHCGACIWLIESTLRKQRGVMVARLNITTKRLYVEWEERQVSDEVAPNTLGITIIEQIISLLEVLGYRAIPYTPDLSQKLAKKEEMELLKALFVAGVGSLCIMMISLGIWFGNSNDEITHGFRWILYIIASCIAVPATLYSVRPFFYSALNAILKKRSSMDVPITIGVLVGLLLSVYQAVIGSEYNYYDASITLLFFLLGGRYLDLIVRKSASVFVQNLVFSEATSVNLVTPNGIELIPIKNAKNGDVIFVAVGGKIPVDGVIVKGDTELDYSIITGESDAVLAKNGAQVISGAINLTNPIQVRIIRLGPNTNLAKIIKMIENAAQVKSKYVELADRVAFYYTPVVLLLSAITLILWLVFSANIEAAITNAISVLIITCPCAIALAVPAVQIVASSKLLSKGILVKIPDAYEKLSSVDTVIFDKTGTLTSNCPRWINRDSFDASDMKLIASMASNSNHPLCKAVVANYVGDLMTNLNVIEKKGFGVEIDDRAKLGSAEFCDVTKRESDSYMEAWFKKVGFEPVRLEFENVLREDAKLVVDALRRAGLDVLISSGDHKKAVEKIAKALDVHNYKSNMKPKDKYEQIEALTASGKKVLMIGDGLNDAPALKLATISMSPSSAIDVVQNYADILFYGKNLSPILTSINVAKKARKLVRQNFAIAIAYNAITVPLAILGFASPIIAAISMSVSSLMVIFNALRA